MPVANAACELIGSVDSDAFSWSSCDSLAPVHGVSVEGIHIHRVQLECIIVDKQRNIYSRNTPRLGKPAQLLTILPRFTEKPGGGAEILPTTQTCASSD